jgi:hypothetical protein
LAPDAEKHAYFLFVQDIEVITDNSGLWDVILVLGDINLPEARWKVDKKAAMRGP